MTGVWEHQGKRRSCVCYLANSVWFQQDNKMRILGIHKTKHINTIQDKTWQGKAREDTHGKARQDKRRPRPRPRQRQTQRQ